MPTGEGAVLAGVFARGVHVGQLSTSCQGSVCVQCLVGFPRTSEALARAPREENGVGE